MPASPQKNKALLFGGVGLVLAAIGVIVSLVLINKPQDTRNKAAVEGRDRQGPNLPNNGNT